MRTVVERLRRCKVRNINDKRKRGKIIKYQLPNLIKVLDALLAVFIVKKDKSSGRLNDEILSSVI